MNSVNPCDGDSTADEPRADGFAADIAAAQRGCLAAFDRLFAGCRPYLWMAADRSLSGELKAKIAPSDVVQETLMQAKANFPRFNGSTEAELKAWLRGILVNNVRDVSRRFFGTAMRALNREVSLDEDGGDRHDPIANVIHTPGSQLVVDEETQRLMAALDQLPNDYRQIIVLRSIEEQSFARIGELIGRSEEAARKLWARAIDYLRLQVSDEPPPAGEACEL